MNIYKKPAKNRLWQEFMVCYFVADIPQKSEKKTKKLAEKG
jgi:hypothetical protein